jgi:hypothetical protein
MVEIMGGGWLVEFHGVLFNPDMSGNRFETDKQRNDTTEPSAA